MGDSGVVVWEGRRFSAPMRDAVVEWRRLAVAEGIPFRVTQGGFNAGGVSASASTHAGDAVDVSVSGLSEAQVSRLVTLGRSVGIAVWFRTTTKGKWGTRAQGFGAYHLHGVPNGWGSPHASAAAQATDYRRSRDGLASHQPDLGPGHVSTYRSRTWAAYQQQQQQQQQQQVEDDMTPEQSKKLDAVYAAVAERTGIERAGESAARQTVQFPVRRGGVPVPLIQEVADAKTGILALQGQVAGLAQAVGSLAAGQGVDLGAIEEAARRGVESGLLGASVTVELGGGLA